MSAAAVGRKDDDGKDRWDLIPIKAMRSVVQVLTWGANHYGANNWMHVDRPSERYYAAALRHLTAWWEGERLDPKTNKPHLAHAACCVLFLLGFELGDAKQ